MNPLSKRMLIDNGLLKATDPAPMKKAVAFCQTIRRSKLIQKAFSDYSEKYCASLPEAERADVVALQARHVDGSMGASKRAELLDWLNSAPAEGNECRALANVRCLSEGIDVPSLDAIMFLSSRDSQIDVVQSVGRVMRSAPGKKFGYIIIPVLVPAEEEPHLILDDNMRFKPVWRVLQALRAHDDRFDAKIKRLELNSRKRPDPNEGGTVVVGPVPGGAAPDGGGSNDDGEIERVPSAMIPYEKMAALQDAIYARMVLKVGNRRYWEQWAKDVAEIARRYSERIQRLIARPGPHQAAFHAFLAELRKSVNPSLDAEAVIEMLSQHYITKPVFEALFGESEFTQLNPVSQGLQGIMDLLEEQAFEKDVITLSRFYDSVKRSVEKIDNEAARQKIITELYDKFFRAAFPLTVKKLGIVYTPVEIVDFINHSVADILKLHFGKTLSDPGVNILDPFTGTGTFIARLIASGLIEKAALPEKYNSGLFANEIILLAYYIASINIESAYHAAMGEGAAYAPFNSICLADTFQLNEAPGQGTLPGRFLKRNAERVEREQKAAIQVIIGNPPYSIGQGSANDNAQNEEYPALEKRISETYAAKSSVNLKKALYDTYIKAFRWASDRIDPKAGGVIGFITNSGWLDKDTSAGLRKCMVDEFDYIYVYNLRGSIRGKKGELAKKEGQNVFDIMTGVAIILLVKMPAPKNIVKSHTKPHNTINLEKMTDFGARIYYFDIGDCLSRSSKLSEISSLGSVLNKISNWTRLYADESGDWFNHRNEKYENYIVLANKATKQLPSFFKNTYSLGVSTNRDSWCYNFSMEGCATNVLYTISNFNAIVDGSLDAQKKFDPSLISWSANFDNELAGNVKKKFEESNIRRASYRPFCKQKLYYSRELNSRPGLWVHIFPHETTVNTVICIQYHNNGLPLVANTLADLHFNGDTQCFPLYYYEEAAPAGRKTLMEDAGADKKYTRHDAITDWILGECRGKYGPKVSKEDIFYFVYGILHSPEYRQAFAADLKKSLPRLPLPESASDFRAFSKAGRALADLHLNYESQKPWPGVVVEGDDSGDYHVNKMRFVQKGDKSAIQYNSRIRISNIPLEAYGYVINGRSAIEWIMERYQIKTDKASGITNDPNDWAKEHGQPRYILDLLLSVITVSMRTNGIVAALPRLGFGAEEG